MINPASLTDLNSSLASSGSFVQAPSSADTYLLDSLFGSENDAAFVELENPGIISSLSVSAQKILAKINEQLKISLPEGVESLPEEANSSDAIASSIVQASTAHFDTYVKQHPELSEEEVITHFTDLVRGGVQKGYDDAFEFLKGIGAFEVPGVQNAVEETKILIEAKLDSFENFQRERLGVIQKTNVLA